MGVLQVNNFAVTNVTTDSITVSWENPTGGIINYFLLLSDNDGQEYNSPIYLDGSVTSYTFTGLNSNAPYRFFLQTVIKDADFIQPIPTITATTTPDPSFFVPLRDIIILSQTFNTIDKKYEYVLVDSGISIDSIVANENSSGQYSL